MKPGTLVRLNDKAFHDNRSQAGELWVLKGKAEAGGPDMWEAVSLATGRFYLWYEWEFEHEEG